MRAVLSAVLVAVLTSESLAAATSISGPTITPTTITFSSPDPDASPVNGSSTATIVWSNSGGSANVGWTLGVQANSSAMVLCGSVPVSAVRVQCNSVSSTGTGNPIGNCANGALALTTSPQTIASGNRQGNPGNFSVVLTFTFTDSWKYPANSSCSLNLTYTITAN